MPLEIAGLGTAVPEHSISQFEAANFAKTLSCHTEDQSSLLTVLYRRTRVARRGSVLLKNPSGAEASPSFFPRPEESAFGPTTRERMERYAQEAPRLALSAARTAFSSSSVRPSQITHLITVSCTGFAAPGTDIKLIKALPLPATVGRLHVGFMGCHGALNGLRAALGFVNADPKARVLLCATELCSLHFQYGWDPDRVVANALFADGSAALVGKPTASQKGAAWRLAACGSFLIPDSEEAMGWRIGDHGFEMILSAQVPSLIRQHLRSGLERWLKRVGLSLKDIRSWAVHPGGPRILGTVADCLNLSEKTAAASREILERHGNLSSPTILFILEKLREEKAPRPCVALAFGPGLQAETALWV
ncbi:MAG: type III polyketide synthase [Candidatus Omnitrophica bacterium]|nr:type III polyketide synthase [Candidatus Omnitrophota bacterium]